MTDIEELDQAGRVRIVQCITKCGNQHNYVITIEFTIRLDFQTLLE